MFIETAPKRPWPKLRRSGMCAGGTRVGTGSSSIANCRDAALRTLGRGKGAWVYIHGTPTDLNYFSHSLSSVLVVGSGPEC